MYQNNIQHMENKSEFWWEFLVRFTNLLPLLTLIVITIIDAEQFDKTFLISLAVIFVIVFIAITNTLTNIYRLHEEIEALKEEIKEIKNGNNEHNIY